MLFRSGYILKDAEPADLKRALTEIMQKGFFYSDLVTGHLIHSMQKMDDDAETRTTFNLSDRDVEFLHHICTELTYKEIAEKMFVSPRTVDGYRDPVILSPPWDRGVCVADADHLSPAPTPNLGLSRLARKTQTRPSALCRPCQHPPADHTESAGLE